MLIKIDNRNDYNVKLVKIDILDVETIEELIGVLGIENFYPNHFQIIEADFRECSHFIRLLCTPQLKAIKNFCGQELDLIYNPYQHSNHILIQNTDLFNKVKTHLQNFNNFE